MKTLRRFGKRLFGWASMQRNEDRLRTEIEEHISSQADEYVQAGLSPAEARRQAVLKFGAVEAVKEEYRDQRGLPLMETLTQEIRHAFRRLRKEPAFSAATILVLGLGLGATTSIFTLVHAVLLKSLPVANPNELYRLGRETHCCMWGGFSQSREFSIVSSDLYNYLHDHTQGFVELAGFSAGSPGIAVKRADSTDPVQRYPSELVSGNYFRMFGINAYAGRMLGPRDDRTDAPPVAVMSFRLWQEKYASDASVIGHVFNVNNKPFTIVGITPPGFFGDTLREIPADFFLPLAAEPAVQGQNSLVHVPDAHWLDLIGRIKPGVAPAVVEAQMRVELKQWLRSHWGEMDATDRKVFPRQILYLSAGGAGITSMREAYEHWLQVLMMAAGVVLLIVCANVGNLMLVRGMEKRQQTALSMALGARPSRMVAQALTESLLLSVLGGAVGLAISFGGTQLILHFAFATIPGLAGVPISASPSMPVLLFAFSIALITGIFFGIAPAWFATRVDPIEALRGANRSTARSASLPRKMMVILQAALSLALLSASGLLTAALQHLQKQDFGFAQERRTIVSIDPNVAGYRAEQLAPLHRRIQEKLLSLPGVTSVALAAYTPMNGDSWNDGVFVDGRPAPGPNEDNSASFSRVTPGYLEAIANPILRGRSISEQDTENSRHVAVVNEAFVRKFFKKQEPIGQHFGRSEPGATRLYEIVGVAKDARYLTYNLNQPIGPFYFLSEDQHDVFPKEEFTQGDVRTHYLGDIVVVTRPGATLSGGELRQALASVDPNLPVSFIRTLGEQVDSQFRQQRLIASLTSLFGILSLGLASVGFYGVTAYNVGRRVKEIGLRVALGASRGNIVTLVLRGALGLLAIGLVLGVPLSLGAGRFLGNQLYGTNPYDPGMAFGAALVLIFSASIAAFIPALRASSISPVQSLRAE